MSHGVWRGPCDKSGILDAHRVVVARHGYWTEAFLHATASATAGDPDVQRYAREVNRPRSSADTVVILTSMLGAALHPDES